jgi:hypothetical protein
MPERRPRFRLGEMTAMSTGIDTIGSAVADAVSGMAPMVEGFPTAETRRG